jgi:tryptophanyl-tRNA synthetase
VIEFDGEFYRAVREENGYGLIDFGLDGVSERLLRRKYVCHDDAAGVGSGDRTAVLTTGFGISGVPHMGTIAQVANAIAFQRAGWDVQIVLGDLDALNSRDLEWPEIERLTDRYESFVEAFGFDTDRGRLRTQFGHPEVAEASYRLSPYVADEDFYETEEVLAEHYENEGVHDGMDFGMKHAILLMASDFVQLGADGGYDDVLVSLGVEEHQYVAFAKRIAVAADVDVRIAGIYSRLIKGFNGHPKMSKSLPGSGITVEDDPETIRERVTSPGDTYDAPEDSVVYQLMCLASDYDDARLDEFADYCAAGGEEWEAAKAAYADYLVDVCSHW